MRLNHVDLIDGEFTLQKDRTVIVENGRITSISNDILSIPAEEETWDLSDLLLVPGFIDIHIHGALGQDVSDGNVNALKTISSYLAEKGVTGFCPTTMMLPQEAIRNALKSAEAFRQENFPGAIMLGLRLEGPFLSKEKCGVQNPEYAKDPSSKYIEELLSGFPEDLVRIIDIAPELPGAEEAIMHLKEKYVLSMAHTAAGYDCAKKAIGHGVRHGTHLFNAMNPLSHHEPGAVGALLEDQEVTCELICDGLHIHPAVLKLAWKLLGEDRAVVVSDAMRASGMPDGEYDLGGTIVKVSQGRTDFGNGKLAGSTTDLYSEFLFLLSLGIPVTSALRSVSINPARVLGLEELTGSLEVGKYADMVALDKHNRIQKVWVRGRLVFDLTKKKGSDEI